MVVLQTIIVAFSMYSALPMPQIEWTRENMRWALLVLPAVGAVIGGVCCLWVCLCGWLHLPLIARGAGLAVLPILLTGGIHMDGYADVADAQASRAEPEKKREILKDPHLGAFAAIRIGVYLIISLAVWTSLPEFHGWAIVCLFMLSRTLSALSLACFPLAEGSGLARSFAEAADRAKLRNALIALTVLLAAALVPAGGAVMLLPAALVFWRHYRMATVDFAGLSGDLCGWYIQSSELWMALGLCLFEYLEKAI